MMQSAGPEAVTNQIPTHEVAAYRESVRRLVEGCLRRIGEDPTPSETQPLLQWTPGDA